jgi:hypothetical protein
MKLAKGVKVYRGKEVFTEEIPDKEAEKLGLKTVKKETPKANK